MQVRRFIVSQIPVAGAEVILSPAEALHAGKVLRLRVGERLDLLDGAGGRAEAVLSQAGEGRRFEGMACRVLRLERCAEPILALRLYIAPPRARLMGDVLRMATELGVRRVTPILCRFGISRPEAGALDGWHQDVLAAAKQSGNPFLPVLDAPTGFVEALRDAAEPGVFGAVPRGGSEDKAPSLSAVEFPRPPSVVGQPSGSQPRLGPLRIPVPTDLGPTPEASKPNGIGPSSPPVAQLGVWIGPEGGFTKEEEEALSARGFAPLAVGPWVLRVETAVPALLGRLWGELAHA
jgi:16S rRNA (uracil1498-N3)-methyltransferase